MLIGKHGRVAEGLGRCLSPQIGEHPFGIRCRILAPVGVEINLPEREPGLDTESFRVLLQERRQDLVARRRFGCQVLEDELPSVLWQPPVPRVFLRGRTQPGALELGCQLLDLAGIHHNAIVCFATGVLGEVECHKNSGADHQKMQQWLAPEFVHIEH